MLVFPLKSNSNRMDVDNNNYLFFKKRKKKMNLMNGANEVTINNQHFWMICFDGIRHHCSIHPNYSHGKRNWIFNDDNSKMCLKITSTIKMFDSYLFHLTGVSCWCCFFARHSSLEFMRFYPFVYLSWIESVVSEWFILIAIIATQLIEERMDWQENDFSLLFCLSHIYMRINKRWNSKWKWKKIQSIVGM